MMLRVFEDFSLACNHLMSVYGIDFLINNLNIGSFQAESHTVYQLQKSAGN